MAPFKGPMLRMCTTGDLQQLASLVTAAQQMDIPLSQEYFRPDWRTLNPRGPTATDAPELDGLPANPAVTLRAVLDAVDDSEFASMVKEMELPGA